MNWVFGNLVATEAALPPPMLFDFIVGHSRELVCVNMTKTRNNHRYSHRLPHPLCIPSKCTLAVRIVHFPLMLAKNFHINSATENPTRPKAYGVAWKCITKRRRYSSMSIGFAHNKLGINVKSMHTQTVTDYHTRTYAYMASDGRARENFWLLDDISWHASNTIRLI